MPPTQCPPYGVCVPVTFVRVRDGDTIEVQILGGAMTWAVRLIDCWCPELHRGSEVLRKLARAAREFAGDVCARADDGDLRWFVPAPKLEAGVTGLNILAHISFDRVPGYLYVGPSQTLNQMLVEKGFASSTKGGELGR